MIIKLSTTILILVSMRMPNRPTRKNRLKKDSMIFGTEGSRIPNQANWLNTDIIMIAFPSHCTCEVITKYLLEELTIFMHSFCLLFRWLAFASSIRSCGYRLLLALTSPILAFAVFRGSFPFRANSISAISECSCIPTVSSPIAKCTIRLFYPLGTHIFLIDSAKYFSYCLSAL